MIAQWLFGSSEARWEACVTHFGQHGMTLPIVPDTLERVLRTELRAEGTGRFATAGWHRSATWQDRIDDWVRRPAPARAWLGVHAHHQEPVAEVSLVTPSIAVFMRHRQNRPQRSAPAHHSIQDAYRAAGRLLWDTEKMVRTGRWPSAQRLLLIDDDLDLPRWGWLDRPADLSPDLPHTDAADIRVMKVSHTMYLEVLSVLECLHHRAPEALV